MFIYKLINFVSVLLCQKNVAYDKEQPTSNMNDLINNLEDVSGYYMRMRREKN